MTLARPRRLGFALVLGLALLVRIGLFFAAADQPGRFLTLDAADYIAAAQDLAAAYLNPGSPAFDVGLKRTPVYPFFLWTASKLSAQPIALAILAQILLSLLTLWLTFRLAAGMLGSVASAELSALFFAIDPASAVYANLLQPETLFTTLLVASALTAWTALRAGSVPHGLWTGLLLGAAVLTRPIAVFFPLLLSVLFLARRATKAACLMLASSALIVGGWVVHNRVLTGGWILSSISGTNVLEYRAADAMARETGRSLEEARRDLQRLASPSHDPAGGGTVTRNAEKTALGIAVLLEHPRGAALSAAHGVFHLSAGTGMAAIGSLLGDPDPESTLWRVPIRAQLALAVPLLALYAAAGRGVIRLWRDGQRTELAFLLLYILYFVLISAGPEANTRFRVPVVPLLAVLAGHGLLGGHRQAHTSG